jgi:formylglycine-generating enzyme required for sulfatase activity
MEDFRGDRAASARRVAVVVGIALVALAVGAYFVNRARMAAANAPLTAGDFFRDCPTCPLMKVLAPGKFLQGSTDTAVEGQPSERPRHAVIIAQPLGFGVQEVTKAQFKEFVDATGRDVTGCASYDGSWANNAKLSWNSVGFPQSASHPVACVSWLDAAEYAQWLSRKTGRHYRLPSASEWEFAARAGSEAERPWGANTTEACAAANVADESAAQRYPGWKVHACNDGYVYTAPVGSFAPNAFGLSDMLGNVFEWVQDCWHDNYQDAPTDGSAWVQNGCRQREMRGGSWFTTPAYVRSAYRNWFEEDYRSNSIGFRVVRELRR